MWKNAGDNREYPHILVRWNMTNVVTKSDFEEGKAMVVLARQCYPSYTLCLIVEGLLRQTKLLHLERSMKTPMGQRLLGIQDAFASFAVELQTGFHDEQQIDVAEEPEKEEINNAVSIIQSECEATTTETIANFSQCIEESLTRSKAIFRHADLPFFLGTVREKTNGTLEDTWIAMISQIPDVSRKKAAAIVERYPTLHSLMQAYNRKSSQSERERMLLDVPGIGPVLSKKLCNCFCGPATDIVT